MLWWPSSPEQQQHRSRNRVKPYRSLPQPPPTLPTIKVGSGAVAIRVKVLAKKVSKPEISCHWLRHAFASWSLHAGANLVDVSKALGHSSVAVTSLYLHSSDKPVSALIDLSSLVDGETVDDSIIYVKTEKIKTSKKLREKIKAPKKGKKPKINNQISL